MEPRKRVRSVAVLHSLLCAYVVYVQLIWQLTLHCPCRPGASGLGPGRPLVGHRLGSVPLAPRLRYALHYSNSCGDYDFIGKVIMNLHNLIDLSKFHLISAFSKFLHKIIHSCKLCITNKFQATIPMDFKTKYKKLKTT